MAVGTRVCSSYAVRMRRNSSCNLKKLRELQKVPIVQKGLLLRYDLTMKQHCSPNTVNRLPFNTVCTFFEG